jgi:hypothetical protein
MSMFQMFINLYLLRFRRATREVTESRVCDLQYTEIFGYVMFDFFSESPMYSEVTRITPGTFSF